MLMMLIAVVLGVSISTRLSLGKNTKGRKRFSWWVINRLAFLVGGVNLVSFVLYFLQERFPQLTGEAAARPTAILMAVVGLSLLIAAVVAGWLTDKFGPKPLLFLSGILAFVAILIIVLSKQLSVIYVSAAVIGISSGIFYSANWALGTRLVPRDEAGRWLGISNVAGTGAGAIGAFIGGPIGDNAGYSVLILIYGLLFLISTLALFPIKTSESV
ncbi:MAG TPA: MFS transporter, partial [Anaerolineaceae bacterium]|nr:MFS transporter [Anaerolineaceae bacterium]